MMIFCCRAEKVIKKAVGNILEKVTLSMSMGQQIEEKECFLLISMRSHEGTLTDEQADAAIGSIKGTC